MLIRVKTPLNNNERILLNSKFVTMRYKRLIFREIKSMFIVKTVRPPIINVLFLASEIPTCCVGEIRQKNVKPIYSL